jgi:hypothetical protein
MQHTKSSIRQSLVEGRLSEAAAAALSYAEYCGLPEIVNALTTLGSRIEDHQRKWETGQISYQAFSLAHAQVTHGLAAWVDRLPDYPKPAGRRRRLMNAATFKKRVLLMLILTKTLVILRLTYHWSTGGFNVDQFLSTVTLLAPALAAYVAVILPTLSPVREGAAPPRYLSGPLITFSYWLFPVYALLLIVFVEMKVKGFLSFPQMNGLLAVVEIVLGGYVGQIVFSVFRKEPGESLFR